ncbi:TPA: hypothetical protein EYH33_05250, partial [Candidatus Bipolaricaulota bacterium]|nr:hypothetical protein [Candidatus Bipolaricaulota bacterium]
MLLLVLGAVFVLAAAGLLVGGGTLIWVENVIKHSEGFYTTRPVRLSRDSYAIVSKPMEIELGPIRLSDSSRWGAIKVEAT